LPDLPMIREISAIPAKGIEISAFGDAPTRTWLPGARRKSDPNGGFSERSWRESWIIGGSLDSAWEDMSSQAEMINPQ
jgi:hypothetical protein